MRGYIALGLTGAVVLLAVLIVLLVAWNRLAVDEVEKLQLYFSPLIALSGTALGFYFGGRDPR